MEYFLFPPSHGDIFSEGLQVHERYPKQHAKVATHLPKHGGQGEGEQLLSHLHLPHIHQLDPVILVHASWTRMCRWWYGLRFKLTCLHLVVKASPNMHFLARSFTFSVGLIAYFHVERSSFFTGSYQISTFHPNNFDEKTYLRGYLQISTCLSTFHDLNIKHQIKHQLANQWNCRE